jgi:hypothetical protein
MGGDHLWDAIGAVSEGLGSLAVFITLGYLAIQVRYGRREMARAVTQGRLRVARELFVLRAENSELSELWGRVAERIRAPAPAGAMAFEELGLSPVEAMRLHAFAIAVWTYQTETIHYVDELAPGERATFDRTIRGMFGTGAVHRYWYDHMREGLNPVAVAYVDKLLANAG